MSRQDNRIRLPASTAGITQYWDDVKTKIEFKPEHIVILAIIIIAIEMFLQVYGNAIFGI